VSADHDPCVQRRQADRQAERQTDRQTNRHIERLAKCTSDRIADAVRNGCREIYCHAVDRASKYINKDI
jgi:hypothetical protein